MARQIFEAVLQDGASTGNGTAYQTNGRATQLVVYAEWSSGGSGGVLSIEEAPRSDYAGTWAVVGTITQGAASSVDAYHLEGAYGAIRARFTTNVTGGTATVSLLGVSES